MADITPEDITLKGELVGPLEDLRDKIAIAAMQGMLADTAMICSWDQFARNAYEMADAMLKQREKKSCN